METKREQVIIEAAQAVCEEQMLRDPEGFQFDRSLFQRATKVYFKVGSVGVCATVPDELVDRGEERHLLEEEIVKAMEEETRRWQEECDEVEEVEEEEERIHIVGISEALRAWEKPSRKLARTATHCIDTYLTPENIKRVVDGIVGRRQSDEVKGLAAQVLKLLSEDKQNEVERLCYAVLEGGE